MLILKYVDDISVKEIAKDLEKSVKSVDGILQRAKIAFKKVYLNMKGYDKNHGRQRS